MSNLDTIVEERTALTNLDQQDAKQAPVEETSNKLTWKKDGRVR